MKFLVCRTSDYRNQPCDEAVQVTFISEDTNHEFKYWMVEIDTLEELINFRNRYGAIILEEFFSWKLTGGPQVDGTIEIYDDYRE